MKWQALNLRLLAMHLRQTNHKPRFEDPQPARPWSLVIMVAFLVAFAVYAAWRVLI